MFVDRVRGITDYHPVHLNVHESSRRFDVRLCVNSPATYLCCPIELGQEVIVLVVNVCFIALITQIS